MNDYKRSAEEYRHRIIDMIEKIENETYLKFIYDLLFAFKKKWGI